MAVRLVASTPAVTSSAVEAEPKPEGPCRPHGQLQRPITADADSLASHQLSITRSSITQASR